MGHFVREADHSGILEELLKKSERNLAISDWEASLKFITISKLFLDQHLILKSQNWEVLQNKWNL